MTEDDDRTPQGFVRGTVKRLFDTGMSAQNVALNYLAEQVGGWKSEFLGIFERELRRFLDRVEPGLELDRLLDGRKLEITATFRLVQDETATSADGGKRAGKRKAGAKRKK